MRAVGIAAILVLSFVWSMWAVAHDRDTAFYLLPGRAWELMLGAILAVGAIPRIRNALVRECAALAGVALIATAVVLFTPDMPFPGAPALLPCLGAALVIHATEGESSVAAKLLSIRPLVFVGLISYSLYLWHWPVYVFSRYVLFRGLSPLETAVLIATSFGLAILSWRFVERPFRRPIARVRLFPAAAAAMAIAFAVGAFAASSNGLPGRLPEKLQQILAEENDAEPQIDHCFPKTARDVETGKLCTIGATSKMPSFLLWGDSHADAIIPPVDRIARRVQRTGVFAGGASCVPIVGVTTWSSACRPFNDAVLKIALAPNITDIILEARWAKYADGQTYGDEPHGRVVITDDVQKGVPAPDNHAVFARGLENAVRMLVRAGKHVVLVASVPEVGWPVPAVLARRAMAHDTSSADVRYDVFMRRQSFVLTTFERLHRTYGVSVIYPQDVLCAKTGCAVSLNGIPLYRDEHHLSVYGALKLEPLMRGIL
jgi:hypothetical protein